MTRDSAAGILVDGISRPLNWVQKEAFSSKPTNDEYMPKSMRISYLGKICSCTSLFIHCGMYGERLNSLELGESRKIQKWRAFQSSRLCRTVEARSATIISNP